MGLNTIREHPLVDNPGSSSCELGEVEKMRVRCRSACAFKYGNMHLNTVLTALYDTLKRHYPGSESEVNHF